MTRVMTSVISMVLFVAVFPITARATEEPQLEGVYLLKGVDVDGSEVQGRVRVLRQGESFLVAWMRPHDDTLPVAVGVGVADGGMLAVVIFYGPLTERVALYRIEEGGRRLVGRWVADGGEWATHSDVLTRVEGEVRSRR